MEGMPGVFKVFYFGSTGLDIKYTPGKSDLNIIVFGNNIPGWVKKIGVLLIRDFNNKLRLGLDDTPIFHHTPIYVDSPSRMGAMLVLCKTINLWSILDSWLNNMDLRLNIQMDSYQYIHYTGE